MDSQRSVNTSTCAHLSQVDSQSVFEKFHREEEAIQKYHECQKLIEQSYLDPYSYFLELCDQIEYTEKIIQQLNFALFEKPKLRMQEKIQNVKDRMSRQGKRIPQHLDLYLEEKFASQKDVENDFQTYKRTYQQTRYLKEKKNAEINNWRQSKVKEFLQEQEIYSYFGFDKYFYDDNIKVPLSLLYKNLDSKKILNLEDQDQLFSVKSVKTDPLLEMVDSDIEKYKSYLIHHYQQPESVEVFQPSQNNIKINKNINIPLLKFPSKTQEEQLKQQLTSQRTNRLLTGCDQDNIDQQIVLLSSRLERTQSKCDLLMKQYQLSIKDPNIIEEEGSSSQNNWSFHSNKQEDIVKEGQIDSNLQNVSNFSFQMNKDSKLNIYKLKKNRILKEIKRQGKEGWIEDQNQIMYAYDVNDKLMKNYNEQSFNKLYHQYSQIECEFMFYESHHKQKLQRKNERTKKFIKIQEFLSKNKKICQIVYHIFLSAQLDLVAELYPFPDNVYPLYNLNYEQDVLPIVLNNRYSLQSKLQQQTSQLQPIPEKKNENDYQKREEAYSPLMAIWRVLKKNKRKPLNESFYIDNNSLQNSLLSSGHSAQNHNYPKGMKVPRILNMELIKEESIYRSSQESNFDNYTHAAYAALEQEDEMKFNNLSKEFYEIYSARTSSRHQIESQSSRSSLGEKEKDKKLFQLIPFTFKYKRLSKNRSKQPSAQSPQSKKIQNIQHDYLISTLTQKIFISNIPKPGSNMTFKQKAKALVQNQTFISLKSNVHKLHEILNEDLIKAASVFKRSGNKDVFKFRWLELRCFTLAWYKSAPELTKDEHEGEKLVIQKKPKGFGEIQIALVEDTQLSKKHCFIVKLPKRNLIIEYDSTRVGLMWSKTIRNMVALKAYIHYLILFGGKNTLFKYFNDLNSKELDLSEHCLSANDISKKRIALEQQLSILIFDSITAHQKLQIICLKNSGLSPVSIKELFKYLSKPLKKTRISSIDLSQNDVDIETIRQLNTYLQSSNCQNLQTLILDDCNLKDDLFGLVLGAIKERYSWQMISYHNPNKYAVPEETSWRQASIRYSNKSNPNSPRGEKIFFFQTLSFAGNSLTDKGLQKFMRTIEEIAIQSQPYIKDLEEFEMLSLDLSRNKFVNELSNFGNFIQSFQIFKVLHLDNMISPKPDQFAAFILSFVNNYNMNTLSLKGNPLSKEGLQNLLKVLDENFTLEQIIADFTNYAQLSGDLTEENKRSNNLRSQFFSFTLLSSSSGSSD